MDPKSTSTITLTILIPLLAWRIYVRFRRMVGKQKLSKVRPWLTVTILPTIILILSYNTYTNVKTLGLLIIGIVIGAFVGLFGLRKTYFESTEQGVFYTPNPYLGISILSVLIVKVIYRLIEMSINGLSDNTSSIVLTPFTLTFVGLLVGYYVTYAIGLLKWKFRIEKPSMKGGKNNT